jgi:tetratricopeptide (TPR) repeat protein
MIHFLKILALILVSNIITAQDFNREFNNYLQKRDTAKLEELLLKWEKKEPHNPELFTSYFNFYFLKSMKEVVTLTTSEPNGESFSIQDSTGNTAGYLGSKVVFNQNFVQKGIDKINEGIKLYPDRLDMRFGKIHVYSELNDWDNFTTEIIATLQRSNQNNNSWTWTDDEPVSDAKDFLLSGIQDYQLKLYETGNDNLLQNMRTIANEVLRYYPTHIESLSNLSITQLLTGEYDKGIETLLLAEKINPTDGIILSNIAHGYKLKGDIENALKYYKKMTRLEDPEAVKFARQQIEELNK